MARTPDESRRLASRVGSVLPSAEMMGAAGLRADALAQGHVGNPGRAGGAGDLTFITVAEPPAARSLVLDRTFVP